MNDKPKWGIAEYVKMAVAIAGGVCTVAAILMTFQGKAMPIANVSIPAGLIFLVAGLIFAHLALGRLISATWVGLIVSMSILGIGLFLGYYLWGGIIIEIPGITRKYDIFRDLLFVLLGILSAVGVLIFLILRARIRRSVEISIRNEFSRIKGRLALTQGVLYWYMKDYKLAIKTTQRALMEKLDKRDEIIAKSNLGYYYAEEHERSVQWENKQRAIKLAKFAYNRYKETFDDPNWVDNYWFVKARFAKTAEEMNEVKTGIEGEINKPDLCLVKPLLEKTLHYLQEKIREYEMRQFLGVGSFGY